MKKNLLSMAFATVVAASLVGCGSTASETQTSSEPKILKTAASFAYPRKI